MIGWELCNVCSWPVAASPWLSLCAAEHCDTRHTSPEQRTEGAGLYSLSRNIGSSVGISVVNALLTRNTQINHAEIAQHVTAVNRAFENPAVTQFWNPLTAAGRAALDGMITQQAQVIAYIDDYKLLMIATLAVIPLLIVFKKARGVGADHTLAVE